MKMKKHLWFALTVIAAVTLLSGCRMGEKKRYRTYSYSYDNNWYDDYKRREREREEQNRRFWENFRKQQQRGSGYDSHSNSTRGESSRQRAAKDKLNMCAAQARESNYSCGDTLYVSEEDSNSYRPIFIHNGGETTLIITEIKFKDTEGSHKFKIREEFKFEKDGYPYEFKLPDTLNPKAPSEQFGGVYIFKIDKEDGTSISEGESAEIEVLYESSNGTTGSYTAKFIFTGGISIPDLIEKYNNYSKEDKDKDARNKIKDEIVTRISLLNREDYFQMFGLSEREASCETIKSRYRKLMKICHSDKNQGNVTAADEASKRINEAYEKLKAKHSCY